jgi:hypothetical protein
MKQIKSNQLFIMVFTLIILSLTTFSFTTKWGLDTYKIYLNNKLVLDLAVNRAKSDRVLDLGKQNLNDELRITYTHCMTKGAGKGRSISLKDERGNQIKKWAFANAKGSNLNMVISIKELLGLEKTHPNQKLTLHYSADELPKEEMLSTINFK